MLETAGGNPTPVVLAVIGVPVVGALVVAGLIAAAVLSHTPSKPSAPAGKAPVSGEQPRQKRLFFQGYVRPQVVTAPDTELVVALFRALDEGDALILVAIDAATGRERWRVSGLGSYLDGHQSTHAALAGQRIALTDHTATLHVLDALSGKELSKLSLSDKANAVCPLPSGNRVLVSQVDERGLYVDLTSSKTEDAPTVRACWEVDPVTGRVRQQNAFPADPDPSPRKAPGFELRRSRWDATTGVASGVKAPGTAYPMAQGFDPRTGTVRWTEPVYGGDKGSVRPDSNTQDALRRGIFVTVYGTGTKDWHLVALTASNGQRLWDVELPTPDQTGDPNGITLSATRVYLGRGDSLEWYDLGTGKPQLHFGDRGR